MSDIPIFGGHASIFHMHPYNYLATLVALVVALIVAVIISYQWGVFMLLGFILIILGGIVIILNRGKNIDNIFILTIGLGVFFIFLHTVGVQPVQITLDFIPGGLEIHNFFNP